MSNGEGASLGDHLIPFPHQFVMIAPPFTDSLFSRLPQVKPYVVTDIGWKKRQTFNIDKSCT